MDTLDGLLHGLSVTLLPINLGAALLGVLLGMVTGVLPGLGTVTGAALVLPLTFTLDTPEAGTIMIAGIYYGAMYGGSITSILLKVPGEAASVVASFDGYRLSQQGRAGPVLGITTIGSFVAGILTAVVVSFFSLALASVGLMFGPAELLALVAGSLLVLSTVSGGGITNNLVPLGLGLLAATALPPARGLGCAPATCCRPGTSCEGRSGRGCGEPHWARSSGCCPVRPPRCRRSPRTRWRRASRRRLPSSAMVRSRGSPVRRPRTTRPPPRAPCRS